jgi:hypothetical protein
MFSTASVHHCAEQRQELNDLDSETSACIEAPSQTERKAQRKDVKGSGLSPTSCIPSDFPADSQQAIQEAMNQAEFDLRRVIRDRDCSLPRFKDPDSGFSFNWHLARRFSLSGGRFNKDRPSAVAKYIAVSFFAFLEQASHLAFQHTTWEWSFVALEKRTDSFLDELITYAAREKWKALLSPYIRNQDDESEFRYCVRYCISQSNKWSVFLRDLDNLRGIERRLQSVGYKSSNEASDSIAATTASERRDRVKRVQALYRKVNPSALTKKALVDKLNTNHSDFYAWLRCDKHRNSAEPKISGALKEFEDQLSAAKNDRNKLQHVVTSYIAPIVMAKPDPLNKGCEQQKPNLQAKAKPAPSLPKTARRA